jgi:hypothetical protein
MSEKREWRNVPPEVIIRDIIESSGLCVPVDYPSERISVSLSGVIRISDLMGGDSVNEMPSAHDWVEYGLSAKETVQNAAENFQRLPSAKDFMNGARSEPVSETPERYMERRTNEMVKSAENFKRLTSTQEQTGLLSPQQRLEALEELRWDLLIVGEQLRNPLQALELLRAMGDRVKVLMDDARAEMEKSQ